MTAPATLHITTWCPFCVALESALRAAGADYEVIDVERDPEAAAWVESVNGGDRVVPTVRYADGGHAVNPPAAEVLERIAALS